MAWSDAARAASAQVRRQRGKKIIPKRQIKRSLTKRYTPVQLERIKAGRPHKGREGGLTRREHKKGINRYVQIMRGQR